MQRANWNRAENAKWKGGGRLAREEEEEVERGVNSLGHSWLANRSRLEHQRAAKYSWPARSFGGQTKPPMNFS